MPDEEAPLSAEDYERRAELSAKKSGRGWAVRFAAIVAALALAGGAVALTAGNRTTAQIAPNQQFAAAGSRQVEPQQLITKETPAETGRQQLAEGPKPKAPPRVIEPPAASGTAPAASAAPLTAIPEIAPSPAEIAPEAAAPQADDPVQ